MMKIRESSRASPRQFKQSASITVYMGLHHGIDQVIFIAIILVKRFFDMPRLLAMSSIDTETYPVLHKQLFGFSCILFFSGSIHYQNGGQNYGNFERR